MLNNVFGQTIVYLLSLAYKYIKQATEIMNDNSSKYTYICYYYNTKL